MHRVGAVLAGGVLFLLAWLLSRRQATQHVGLALLACVVLQVLLGVANVVFGLPLLLAVAHNAGAALLVVVMICVNYRLVREGAAVRAERRGNERTEHKNSYA